MSVSDDVLRETDSDKEYMLGVPEDGEEIVLVQHRAMVEMPEHAVEVELRAKVYHDGQLINVGRVLTMDDIRDAFRKADDGYIDDDDRFVITDKGLQWMEAHGEGAD